MTSLLAAVATSATSSHSLAVDILTGAIFGGTAILYAGLGETISERAGVINVGTEGTMLVGALAGYAGAVSFHNVWLGVLVGALAGAALAAVHAVMVVYRGASQLASGLVVMFLAIGLTDLYGNSYVSTNITDGFNAIAIPGLSKIPYLGAIFFDHDPLVYVSYAMVPAVGWLIFRSRWGLLLRTAGERPDVLNVYGFSARKVRFAAVVAGGALAGVGGAQLATAVAQSWSQDMTAGRGFVAVALVIFAGWNPYRVVAGAYLFGAAITLGNELQIHGVKVNPFLVDSIPYLLTLIVLTAIARKQGHVVPQSLGQNLQ
jgi:general nucleoside transport system permease protein